MTSKNMKPRIKRGSQATTLSGLIDRRRARTASGALLELAMLETEKTRLLGERRRIDERNTEISTRIAAIDEKAKRLYEFVDRPDVQQGGTGTTAPLPSPEMANIRVKRRVLSY